MSTEDSERLGEQILAQLETIANKQGNSIRQRLAADLSHLPIDEQAFSLAIDDYDEALPDDALRGDDQIEALRAFLIAYQREAGR